MKKKISFISILLLLMSFTIVKAQIKDNELFSKSDNSTFITLPTNISFSAALKQISDLFKSFDNKIILNLVKEDWILHEKYINIHFSQALKSIIDKYHLNMDIKDSLIIVTKKELDLGNIINADNIYSTQQLKINAMLFEANTNELEKRGIDWEGIISKHGMVIGANSSSGTKSTTSNYSLNIQLEGDAGPFSAYSNALFDFLESEELGEIEAKLSITVKDKEKGVMQVGSDFSIKQRDFAGNVMDAFYPTGTIIEVEPHIYQKDTLKFAQLNLNVERSFVIPNEVSTIVKKTSANSKIILKNGEEKIIAGLLYNQTRKIRSGIPVLKDLPWWFLGLRYLTGSDSYENIQKEVILLIKMEIIPSLKEQYD